MGRTGNRRPAGGQPSLRAIQQFSVGAAILDGAGKIHIGCNVENASYSLGNCAERTAVYSARVNHGMREVVAVCIYTPTATPTRPAAPAARC